MRVTNKFITNALINQINKANTDMNNQYNKISSGNNFLKPSEAPSSNSIAMELHNSLNEKKQYITNIESASDWYTNSDASLTQVESIIQRCRELANQAANGVYVKADYDAMAAEINQSLEALIDIANTHVGEEYIFAGAKVDNAPVESFTSHQTGTNSHIVNMLGEVFEDINANNPSTVKYYGGDKRLISQIDTTVTLDKSLTALEMFFGHGSVVKPPIYTEQIPNLEESTPLETLNGGRGVQPGSIRVTDHAGVTHDIDLSSAVTLADVMYLIGEKGNFEAGLASFPSETAVSLGLYRKSGNSKTLKGLSLGPLHEGLPFAKTTPLAHLNKGEGIRPGYLNINAADGRNFRVDVAGCKTIGDVCDAISAANGGDVLKGDFDLENQCFVVTDLTCGNGEFSIDSVSDQLYIKDLGSHTAENLGILKTVGAGDTIISDFREGIDSESSPLSIMNDNKGVNRGYFVIKNHAGKEFKVDATSALTHKDIIKAINDVSDGSITASFDDDANRLVIKDTSVGTKPFGIGEFHGTEAVKIADPASVAGSLGILKSTNGNGVTGDILKDGGGNVAKGTTKLTDLVPPIPQGHIVIKSGKDEKGTTINLCNCETVNDVVNAINAGSPYKAVLEPEGSLYIFDDKAPAGTGLTVEEVNNTARDLGLLTDSEHITKDHIIGSPISAAPLPTLECSEDLNPRVTGETKLMDLNGGFGVTLGTIRITDKAGHAANIDLRGSETVQDVLDKINSQLNGIYIEASINADGNGIAITDQNHGASGKLTVIDTDGTCAESLGIAGTTYDHTINGKDIDPAVTADTPLSALKGGIPTGKVFIQSGYRSTTMDLSQCKTVGDVIDKLSNSEYDLGLQAWISEDGKHLKLTNTDGLPFIKLTDIDESGMCESMGFSNSSGLFSTLIDLRDNMLRGDTGAISNISIKQLDDDLHRVLELHTEVGARTNRVNYTKEKLESVTLNIKEMLGNVEELDVVEAIIQMTQMETAYQASLQVGSRIMQLSLLDFLR